MTVVAERKTETRKCPSRFLRPKNTGRHGVRLGNGQWDVRDIGASTGDAGTIVVWSKGNKVELKSVANRIDMTWVLTPDEARKLGDGLLEVAKEAEEG